jgi:hypothetical protein
VPALTPALRTAHSLLVVVFWIRATKRASISLFTLHSSFLFFSPFINVYARPRAKLYKPIKTVTRGKKTSPQKPTSLPQPLPRLPPSHDRRALTVARRPVVHAGGPRFLPVGESRAAEEDLLLITAHTEYRTTRAKGFAVQKTVTTGQALSGGAARFAAPTLLQSSVPFGPLILIVVGRGPRTPRQFPRRLWMFPNRRCILGN